MELLVQNLARLGEDEEEGIKHTLAAVTNLCDAKLSITTRTSASSSTTMATASRQQH